MTIDLNAVLYQKRELDIYADNLRSMRNRLIDHRNRLDDCWMATEIGMIDDAIDKIGQRINRMADELNDIGIDILKTYEQLEEEERIEEERQEKERQEKERLEKEKQEKEKQEKERQEKEKQEKDNKKGWLKYVWNLYRY